MYMKSFQTSSSLDLVTLSGIMVDFFVFQLFQQFSISFFDISLGSEMAHCVCSPWHKLYLIFFKDVSNVLNKGKTKRDIN